MTSIEIDASAALAVAADLEQALTALPAKVRASVSKGALNIKNGMKADMAASEHFGQAASSISYDLNGSAYAPEAEIGPRKGSPGSIANIAYFGGARGGGTVRDPMEPANEEQPNFETALTALLSDL